MAVFPFEKCVYFGVNGCVFQQNQMELHHWDCEYKFQFIFLLNVFCRRRRHRLLLFSLRTGCGVVCAQFGLCKKTHSTGFVFEPLCTHCRRHALINYVIILQCSSACYCTFS